ncbi:MULTISPECIES: hypothetical protein [unclassified Pseudomonas]|uniref:hypothetical protein n=1 Tax=unclassified Pseudomonas TaxID=196821 RepID=UPI002E815F5D|nr:MULTISPECIES: hypothetical protein [unclassified Pseudomonas]
MLALVSALSACGKKDEPVAQAPAEPPAAKVYLVGVESAYAPFSAENEQKNVVGFDIDVMKSAGAKDRH